MVTSQETMQGEAGGFTDAHGHHARWLGFITLSAPVQDTAVPAAVELQAPLSVAQAAASCCCCCAGHNAQGGLQRKLFPPVQKPEPKQRRVQLIVQHDLAAFFSSGWTASTW